MQVDEKGERDKRDKLKFTMKFSLILIQQCTSAGVGHHIQLCVKCVFFRFWEVTIFAFVLIGGGYISVKFSASFFLPPFASFLLSR